MSYSLAQLFQIMKESPEKITMEESLNQWLKQFDAFLIQTVLETLDKELYAYYYTEGWRIDRKEPRQIQFIFGSVAFTRRRLRKKGEASIVPLDRVLGIKKWSRYSENVKKKIAEAGMETPFRTAARSLRRLSRIQVSHTTVHSVTQKVGEKVNHYLQHRPLTVKKTHRRKPTYVFIEGDGLHIGGREGKPPIIHRVLIHEGVRRKKKRHELMHAVHFSSVESSKKAFEKAARYLHAHYDLKETIVLSNSDGGSGYQKVHFEDFIGRAKAHEHFRDRFHVNKKIKDRLSFDRPMQEKIRQAYRHYDWQQVERVLETTRSRLVDLPEVLIQEREEKIERLRGYLKRNWPYLKSIEARGLPMKKGLGVCETSHRTYSYRMKKQGRSWSKEGAKNMVSLLTVKKNHELHTALTTEVDQNVPSLGEEIKGASRRAMKKVKVDHLRVKTGKIANYGSTSSFVGKLVQTFG